jgi:hypothetical protein
MKCCEYHLKQLVFHHIKFRLLALTPKLDEQTMTNALDYYDIVGLQIQISSSMFRVTLIASGKSW